MSLKGYIKNKEVNHFTVGNIEVFIKDPAPEHVSVKNVINSIMETVPRHLLRNLDSLYVGQFEFLQKRNLQATYENSSIFVTNEQEDEDDMFDDILHEIAHSVEELYVQDLYSDNSLEKEFLAKRKNMWYTLKSKGFDIDLSFFLNPEYDEEFDNFLYNDVGYPILSILTANIYHSPYAATSLREYFADGFEAFFMEDEISKLQSLCPRLYRKITELLEN
jgi:hypothetical protein